MKRDLPGIQYLRAAAVTMVVCRHSSGMMGMSHYFGHRPYWTWMASGAAGVDLFFCISGFIIIYVSLNPDLSATMPIWDYFRRRFARIVPFMWVVVLAYAALRFAARDTFPAASYLRSLFLFPIGPVEPVQIWTLRCEAVFYIVFAITGLRRHWTGLVAWVFLPMILWLTGVDLQPLGNQLGALAALLVNNINWLFGAGVLLGVIFLRRFALFRPRDWAGPALAVALACLWIALSLFQYERTSLQVIAFIPLFSLCLVLGVIVPVSTGVLARVFGKLGDASYAIYLVHAGVISFVLGEMAQWTSNAPDIAIFLGTVSSALLGGVAVHQLVEKPIVAWTQARILKRQIPIGTAR